MNIQAIIDAKNRNDAYAARLYQYQATIEKRINEEFLKQCGDIEASWVKVKGYSTFGRGYYPKFFNHTSAETYTSDRYSTRQTEPDSYPVLHKSRYMSTDKGYVARYTPQGRGRVLQENLKVALKSALKAVGKSSLPVLHNVLLRQEGDTLSLSTTNLEYAYRATIPFSASQSQIWEDINITTDAKCLYDYVSELAPEAISLLQWQDKLTLKCGNQTANLTTIEAAQFPVLPTSGKLVATLHDTRKWLDALKVCANGASKEDNRPILTGVHLVSWGDNTARIESMTGYTITVRQMKDSLQVTEPIDIIIPAKSLMNICAGVNPDEPIEVYYTKGDKSGGFVSFKQGNEEYISQLIEGKFPDAASIIPVTSKMCAELDVDAVVKAMKGKWEKDELVSFIFEANKTGFGMGKLTLRKAQQVTGSIDYTFEVAYTGESLTLQFKAHTLLPVLKSIAAELPATKTKVSYTDAKGKGRTKTTTLRPHVEFIASDNQTPVILSANGNVTVIFGSNYGMLTI